MNWQPIETAPTNESVLVYIPNAPYWGAGIYRAIKVVDLGDEIRWNTTALHCGRDISATDYAPTHWMPLPEPPKDDAELAKGARP